MLQTITLHSKTRVPITGTLEKNTESHIHLVNAHMYEDTNLIFDITVMKIDIVEIIYEGISYGSIDDIIEKKKEKKLYNLMDKMKRKWKSVFGAFKK